MQIGSGNLTLAWARWHKASDAYAVQLRALQNGVPGAGLELQTIGKSLREYKAAVEALSMH